MNRLRYTHHLAKIAADTLKATGMSTGDYPDQHYYLLPAGQPLKKDELRPGVQADNQSVTLAQRHYQVRFYVYRHKSGEAYVCSVNVRGWPDNGTIEEVLAAWNDERITAAYTRQIAWLAKNPEYRQPAVMKTTTKSKLHPSATAY